MTGGIFFKQWQHLSAFTSEQLRISLWGILQVPVLFSGQKIRVRRSQMLDPYCCCDQRLKNVKLENRHHILWLIKMSRVWKLLLRWWWGGHHFPGRWRMDLVLCNVFNICKNSATCMYAFCWICSKIYHISWHTLNPILTFKIKLACSIEVDCHLSSNSCKGESLEWRWISSCKNQPL